MDRQRRGLHQLPMPLPCRRWTHGLLWALPMCGVRGTHAFVREGHERISDEQRGRCRLPQERDQFVMQAGARADVSRQLMANGVSGRSACRGALRATSSSASGVATDRIVQSSPPATGCA
jgi:hypothetical protein